MRKKKRKKKSLFILTHILVGCYAKVYNTHIHTYTYLLYIYLYNIYVYFLFQILTISIPPFSMPICENRHIDLKIVVCVMPGHITSETE